MTLPPTVGSAGPFAAGPGNLAQALSLVHTGLVSTRSELTERLGVTRTGAGGILRELETLQLVRTGPGPQDRGSRNSAGGRPSPAVTIAPTAPAGLAVQFDADAAMVAEARLGGQLDAIDRIALPHPNRPDEVLGIVLDLMIRRLKTRDRWVGIGIAIPSAVGPDGVALSAHPLDWPPNIAVGQYLSESLAAHGAGDVDLQVGNDANLAALAESRHGAGRGAAQMLFLSSWPHGVGGGLVIGGRLHTGSAGYALEVGHTTVAWSGKPCHCGNTGCLEVHGTPAALLDLLPAADRDPDVSAAVRRVLQESGSDPAAAAAVRTVLEHLATGLGTLVNILNPDRIVLGELFAELLRADEPGLRAAVSRRSYLAAASQIPIVPAQLARPSLAGAAELALQPLLDNPRLLS